MSNIISLPKRPREVTMDAPVVGDLRASIAKLTAEEFKCGEAERGKAMIEKGLNMLRDNAGAEAAIQYLSDTLVSISGGATP